MENSVAFIATPTISDGSKVGLVAQPVYLVDPCQAGSTPIRTATVLNIESVGAAGSGTGNISSPPPPAGISYAGLATQKASLLQNAKNTYFIGQDFNSICISSTSATHAANTIILEVRNLTQILAIHMAASAGTATLVISGSFDGATALQIDSIAAAATTDLQYTLANNVLNGTAQAGSAAGTGISTVKLNPLAFRFIHIVAGDAGVGNTTTTTIGMK